MTNGKKSETEMLKLIHELKVHQKELELQNEELNHAQVVAEIAKEKYANLYDFAPSGYVTLSKTGDIIELNLTSATMLGRELPKLIKSQFSLFLSPETRSVFNLFFDNIFENKSQATCEVTLLKDSESPMHVLLAGIISENEELCHLTMVDNTERKQVEEALKRSKEKYQKLSLLKKAIIESPTGIIVFALDENYCYLDFTLLHQQTMKAIWGVDIEIESNMLNFIKNEKDREKAKANFDRALAGESFILVEEYGDEKLGRTFYEDRYGPIYNEKNTIVGLSVFVVDITDRMRAEKALRESEEKHRVLFESMAQGVVYQNADGAIIDANPSAQHLLGLTLDQMQGRSSIDPRWKAIHEDGSDFPGETHPAMVALEKGVAVKDVIMGIFNPSKNEYRWINVNAIPQFNPDEDKPFRAFATLDDITERKLFEEHLRQTQKMEAIGVLTGGIAHEFNNLLAPILGYTEMLITDKSEDDPDQESLLQIQEAGDRAKRLIQQMLAYGRQSMSQTEPVKLELLIEDTINLIKNSIPSNIFIKKEIEVNLPSILGMPDEIHQVLLNLCLNASQAMPNGGDLIVSLKKGCVCEFCNKGEEDFISLLVKDTGCGMDQATKERIFDPFFTTREVGKGSGLGLSVALGIVEQHKGHINVKSQVGEGTTVHVCFPVSPEEAKLVAPQRKPLIQGTARILVTDDEPMFLRLEKRMLEKLGYTVVEFSDCEKALNQFSKHPQDFDLVITDYGMPKMNGKLFAKKIKEIRPDIPVILATGYGDLVPREDIHKWGMNDLIGKPFKQSELSEVVRGVLGTISDGV